MPNLLVTRDSFAVQPEPPMGNKRNMSVVDG